jgi:hypothetical protein
MAWIYYEKDGAFFRREEDKQVLVVDDVWNGKNWVPYRGRDPQAPVWFGSPIKEAQLPSNSRTLNSRKSELTSVPKKAS